MKSRWAVGNIVQLKSGSPDLYIMENKGETIIVAWPIADAKISWAEFPKTSLSFKQDLTMLRM